MGTLPTLDDFFKAHGMAIHAPRVVMPFHADIFRLIRQWITGTLPGGKRHLAICIPPRHGKTLIARDAVSYGLGCFPDSEWIYTGYSATLAVTQTLAIKDACGSSWYQRIFPYVGVQPGKGRQDYFRTAAGGAVYGVGVGGTITGFGAGKKRPEFGGGIIIDDPLQAMDATSVTEREKCNRWYSQVLYSRRNSATTPIMLIMQRLHELDLVGYVQEQEGDLWHVHTVPVCDESGAILWPETFSADSMRRMQEIDPFSFSSQYLQAPTPQGGAMVKEDWIQRYEALPAFKSYGIFADTAQKTGEHNDFTVLLCAGTDGCNVYVIDVLRDKLEAPDLIAAAKVFWKRHRPNRISNPARFLGFFVEDKVSGTGLIQTLRAQTDVPVVPVQRNRDKVSRLNDVLPYIRGGRLWIPQTAPWASAYVAELISFSPAMTHLHDDQVDPTVDAIGELLSPGGGLIQGGDWS